MRWLKRDGVALFSRRPGKRSCLSFWSMAGAVITATSH
jgi:hypothetical protein